MSVTECSSSPELLLDPSTSHEAVKEIVRERWDSVQRGEFELCLGLRRLFRDNVHRGEGVSRFADWAERRFDIPGKLADLFSFLGSHLERLPRTRAALERGEITYTKAREFVRVATPENEGEWLAFAVTHTNRELERRAARVREGTTESKTKVVSRHTPEELQAMRMAREILTKELGEPVPATELFSTLAKVFVERGQPEDRGSGDPKPAPGPAFPVKPRPYLAIHLCPQCLHTWVPVPRENLEVPFERWLEELKNGAKVVDLTDDFLCDCEGQKHRRDRCPNARPTVAPPAKSRYISRWVKEHIEARDGFRCRTPGCGNPVPLENGHLRAFRDGTPALPPFLCRQCATCNDLIETGRLVVKGEAPFEQYYLGSGEFLGYGFDPYPHVGKSGDPEAPEAGRRPKPPDRPPGDG